VSTPTDGANGAVNDVNLLYDYYCCRHCCVTTMRTTMFDCRLTGVVVAAVVAVVVVAAVAVAAGGVHDVGPN
jgi:hypothetical protein